MHIESSMQKRGKRHHIRISAEPKSAATRALMRRIRREVAAFTKKWKAHVAKQARKAKARRRGRK